MTLFRNAVRALGLLAIVTGAVDVIVGLSAQQMIGAALDAGAYADPLLNSQIRYLGSIWLGFGLLLLFCLSDIRAYAPILRGAFAIVFLGGLGRVASVLQFGFPPSTGGTGFVVLAIAIEILAMPLLMLGLRNALAASRPVRGTPV